MHEPAHLLTVGHSHHCLDHFLGLLASADIDAIADVRSWPRSRHAPQYNAEEIRDALATVGIKYVFLGRELGGRPAAAELYDDEGHVLYDRVAATPAFAGGMTRVLDGGARMRVAVMCAEENPTHCHRRLLVSRVALEHHGAAIEHLRGDGRIEPEGGFAQTTAGQLFSEVSETPWRSTRSVSRKRVPSTSSAA